MSDMRSELEDILQRVVTNKTLITEEVVGRSLGDMEDIVKQRDLENPFMLDIAIYRFFVRINAKAPDSVVDSYKEALNRLKITAVKDSGEKISRVGLRRSFWI